MSHPESCRDPNCTLTYVQHLQGIGIAAQAMPTRGVNKEGNNQPPEPLINAVRREKRWERDTDAYKRLYRQGHRPPQVDGSALREKQAENKYDMETRLINYDYEHTK